MLPVALFLLAACQPSEKPAETTATPTTPVATQAAVEGRAFSIAYQSKVGGEFEPCG